MLIANYSPPTIVDEPDENIDKSAGPVKVIAKEQGMSGKDGIPIDPDPLVTFTLNPDPSIVKELKTLTSFGLSATLGESTRN